MLGEGVEADEDIRQLARKLRRPTERDGAMSGAEMDGFVAGIPMLPDKVGAGGGAVAAGLGSRYAVWRIRDRVQHRLTLEIATMPEVLARPC